jgi:hypothetical protein
MASAGCYLMPSIIRWFFLNVTSDIPAASAIVAWLFGSLLPTHARHNTEAASPIGSLPGLPAFYNIMDHVYCPTLYALADVCLVCYTGHALDWVKHRDLEVKLAEKYPVGSCQVFFFCVRSFDNAIKGA